MKETITLDEIPNHLSLIKNYFGVNLKDSGGKNRGNILQYLFSISNFNLYIYILHVHVFNRVLPALFYA